LPKKNTRKIDQTPKKSTVAKIVCAENRPREMPSRGRPRFASRRLGKLGFRRDPCRWPAEAKGPCGPRSETGARWSLQPVSEEGEGVAAPRIANSIRARHAGCHDTENGRKKKLVGARTNDGARRKATRARKGHSALEIIGCAFSPLDSQAGPGARGAGSELRMANCTLETSGPRDRHGGMALCVSEKGASASPAAAAPDPHGHSSTSLKLSFYAGAVLVCIILGAKHGFQQLRRRSGLYGVTQAVDGPILGASRGQTPASALLCRGGASRSCGRTTLTNSPRGWRFDLALIRTQ